MKRTISEPFAFHHVTHTNRGHFGDFERTHKNELIADFSAIRAGQQSRKEIRGIRVDSLSAARQDIDVKEDKMESPLASPTSLNTPGLPTTPPRPQPPPKNSPPPVKVSIPPPVDVQLSRSVENFSRPSPRSPVSPVTPTQTTSSSTPPSPMASSSPVEGTVDVYSGTMGTESPSTASARLSPSRPSEPTDKPLPELPLPPGAPVPFVFHAVSTDDNTARPIPTGPLPKLPGELADVPEEQEASYGDAKQPPTSATSQSLRHMHTFPSALYSDRRASKAAKRESMVLVKGLASPCSASALRPAVVPPFVNPLASPTRSRISIGLKTIEAQDWEDAIDYSWDHDVEVEENPHWSQDSESFDRTKRSPSAAMTNQDSCPQSPTIANVPLRRTSRNKAVSKSNSQAPISFRAGHARLDSEVIPNIARPDSPVGPLPRARDSPVLRGLGIEQPRVIKGHRSTSSLQRDETPRPERRPALSHQASSVSSISKSSSQESIILSIASSIISTQRSSNSTSSLTELTPSTVSNERSFASQPQTPKDDICDCSGEKTIVRRNSDGSNPPELPEPILLPYKFDRKLLQFPPASTIAHRRTKSHASALIMSSVAPPPPKPEVIVTPNHSDSPSSPSHSRKSSGSRVPVPLRTSSIAPLQCPQDLKKTAQILATRRQRSATISSTSSRPRHKSRASYSLFPGAATPVPS